MLITRHFNFFNSSEKLTYNILVKTLLVPTFNTGGRNADGLVTSFHRGGDLLSRYAYLDKARSFFFLVPGIVTKSKRFFYKKKRFDLIIYDNGFLGLIQAIEGLQTGSLVSNTGYLPIFFLGSCSMVSMLPIGTIINNIRFGQSYIKNFCSSAGTSAAVLRHFNRYSLVSMPSGEKRLIKTNQNVFIGKNESFVFIPKFSKAGDRRRLGWRPTVRGVAMNPIDHPHGGGQGKTSGGQPSVSPWGVYTKGKRTKRLPLSQFRVLKNIKTFTSRKKL